MRAKAALVTAVTSTWIAAFAVFGATPSIAQTRVASVEELRRELSAGDLVTIVSATGPPVEGRLVRVGDNDVEIRLDKRAPARRGLKDVKIPFTAISSLDRPRDSTRNGAVIGAAAGAIVGGAMFLTALAIDRNEVDEWAGFYAAAAAVSTGTGALAGWAIDAGHAKPHIRFEAAPEAKINVSVRPGYPRGPRIALAVTVSR